MTPNHRPYRDIPTQHKPVAWWGIFWWAFFACAIILLVWQCTVRRLEITRTLSPVEKAEHDRLLLKHGLQGFSVVLVKDEGLFFERGGRLNKFQ